MELREEVTFVETGDGQRLALTEVSDVGAPASESDVGFLLIHGFAQNRKGFTLGPMPRTLLERGARVFIGELRGHGESRVESSQVWSLATHLEQDCPALVLGAMRATGLPRIHLIGHSMGGLLGCALLAGELPLASLTLAATPLRLGAARPLVRLASLLMGPLATLAPKPQRVPMDLLLRILASPLAQPDARGPLWAFQRLTRLANPAAAAPEALREILTSADPESPHVMEELARNAVLLRSQIAGVDLVAAVRGATIPIAAIVGSDDIFAPRAAIAPLERGEHQGPRKVVEIAHGTHVDVVMGDHVSDTLGMLWDFLTTGA